MERLTPADFALAFGTEPTSFSDRVVTQINAHDFRYRTLAGEERDAKILEALGRIEEDTQAIGAPERRGAWERGWAENLGAFEESGGDLQTLVPKFLRPNQALRWQGNYIVAPNPTFELDFITVFRTWLYETFFAHVPAVYEFGAGTGFNLAWLAELLPDKEMWGLDFVPSAVSLIDRLGASGGWDIKGRLFDMTVPDLSFRLRPDGAVMTFGAIEQLAGKFRAFLDYLLGQRPALVIHVEPTAELYDERRLFDWLALKFHRKRGYTQGLLPELQALAQRGDIELVKAKRLGFGSLFMEGYTLLVWRPRSR